jgi:CubicO group peptidase (beta-lactamase class C family)
MQNEVKKILNQAITSGVFPGAVVGVIDNGIRTIVTAGTQAGTTTNPVTEDTVYDIASVTKAIATASVLMKLIENKKLKVTDYVSDIIDSFGNTPEKRQVTILHLLTYTLDLEVPSLASLATATPDEIIKCFISAPTKVAPGTVRIYTNSTAILMGLVIKKVSGKAVDATANEYFYQPLEMNHTTFHPKELKIDTIAPTEILPDGTIIHGIVHDEGTRTLQQKYYLGASGLFSTASNILTYLEMLLSRGTYKNKQIFKLETINMMFDNYSPNKQQGYGLGWDLNQPLYMGSNSHDQMFGKTGFTGCILIGDLTQNKAMALLCNRTYPHRPPNSDAINEVRRALADCIFKI